MRILHIGGPERQGGAAAATSAVQRLVGGDLWTPEATTWQQAWRTIGGYRSRVAEADVLANLARANLDGVHLHNFKALGTGAIAACKRAGVPVVWSCYDYWLGCPRDNLHGPQRICWSGPGARCLDCYQPKGRRLPKILKWPLLRRREARILRWINQVDCVIALSEHSSCMLSEQLGVTAPIRVVPPPVEVPQKYIRVRGLGHRHRIPVVMWAGWLARNKGIEMFLRAAELVERQRPLVGFVAYGTVSDRDYAQQIIDWGVRDGVFVLTNHPRDTILSSISVSDVLVVPEQWHNMYPIIIAEAIQIGTPVVASNLGGIPEMLPHECQAQYDDPQSFADRILAALDGKLPPPEPLMPNTEIVRRLEEVYQCASRSV